MESRNKVDTTQRRTWCIIKIMFLFPGFIYSALCSSVYLCDVEGWYSLCLLWSTVKPGAITTAESYRSELRAPWPDQPVWIMENKWLPHNSEAKTDFFLMFPIFKVHRPTWIILFAQYFCVLISSTSGCIRMPSAVSIFCLCCPSAC